MQPTKFWDTMNTFLGGKLITVSLTLECQLDDTKNLVTYLSTLETQEQGVGRSNYD